VREIDLIRANTSRKRDGCGPLTTNKNASKARKIQGFYEAQNENIERLLKPVDDHRRQAKEEQGASHLKYQIAVQGSFIANVLLAGLQLYGAASSGSLSLFTTMADALFDPLSNVTLILCNRAVKRVDARKFPSGKARIETAGNIFFCFLMCAVSAIIIVESIRELVIGSVEETKKFHLPSVIAVAVAFCTKLGLFLYCWALRNMYSQIRILWEDHRNDLLINGFGVLTSIGGSKLRWWIDPMGAIILSCLIIFLWLRTAYSEFQLLIGVTADTHMLQLITYISMTHSPFVRQIDTVRAYHSGPRLIVEVDIVMSPDESLRATHDVAEELQTKLESLPNVERAYVHVDYETSHAPEHFLKKEL
jgi:cation diffusion facilitator family transporter